MAVAEDPERILDQLVEAGLVETVGDELTPTPTLLERRETLTEKDDLRSRLPDIASEGASAFLELAGRTPSLLADYVILSERTELGHGDKLRALSIFDGLLEDAPDEGAPKAFLPVAGDRLPLHVNLYEKAIVYIWREECPPCATLRERFDAIFDAPPADVGLFSVYGPDHARALYEWYDVSGGPAILYFIGGEVDARMYGDYERSTIETEIDKLRDR